MVEPTDYLVDIGCDHAFLAIDLVSEGKAKKALCTDINEGPLKIAKGHIKDFNLENSINTCLSDGLVSVSKDEKFTAATICGMGGLMGLKIMHESEMFFREMSDIYLQLQSDLNLVRLYLKKYNYSIVFEDMIFEDGKYYTVLHVKSNAKDVLSDANFENVPAQLKDEFMKLGVSEASTLTYPFYEGEDVKIYHDFLDFLIYKYENVKGYLPDDSDRCDIIERELAIMKFAKEKNS